MSASATAGLAQLKGFLPDADFHILQDMLSSGDPDFESDAVRIIKERSSDALRAAPPGTANTVNKNGGGAAAPARKGKAGSRTASGAKVRSEKENCEPELKILSEVSTNLLNPKLASGKGSAAAQNRKPRVLKGHGLAHALRKDQSACAASSIRRAKKLLVSAISTEVTEVRTYTLVFVTSRTSNEHVCQIPRDDIDGTSKSAIAGTRITFVLGT